MTAPDEPTVSFIVPVRNDAVRLEQCLQSIKKNFRTPGQIEVVVIDNGSIDGSADVARQLGARVLISDGSRVSGLRNMGARHCAGQILAFVDADNEIADGWVAAAVDSLKTEAAGAVGAQYRAPANGTWVQRTYGYLRGVSRGRHDVDWLGSGNLAVWRHAFDTAGGFDVLLDTCEDVDLCNRLRSHHFRIVSDARLDSVHHGDPRTLRELFIGELWRGRDNLRVTFRGPFSWRAIPSAIAPIVDAVMLLMVAGGLLGWAVGARPGRVVAAAGLAAIAAMAGVKVVRAATRERRSPDTSLLHVFVVACVYDLGRALALVVRAPHRGQKARHLTVKAL